MRIDPLRERRGESGYDEDDADDDEDDDDSSRSPEASMQQVSYRIFPRSLRMSNLASI